MTITGLPSTVLLNTRVAVIAEAGYNREMVFNYVEEVAAGFRQPIPKDWPPEVRTLIEDCWHQVGDAL